MHSASPDIVEVPRPAGSLEAVTLLKPAQLLAAMDRHPGKVIVFLDAYCAVRGQLDELATITSDVSFYGRVGGCASVGLAAARPSPLSYLVTQQAIPLPPGTCLPSTLRKLYN